MVLQLSNFFLPFIPLCSAPPLLPSFPLLSSCPWVVHVSSLASTFPILFLTSPYPLCTYHLCFLFPVTFTPFFPLSLPAGNPACDFHFCDSSPVVVVCLVCFRFFSFPLVDSFEFVVTLLFTVLIIFFFDKFL